MLAAAALALSLASFAPVVAHDASERFPLSAVDHGAPAVYARAVPSRLGGEWLQYWFYYRYQDQDRGIVRTGRHDGDWEMAMYRVDGSRLVEAVYAQHHGGERCGAPAVQLRDAHPVVFPAHGSHASYFRAGTRDRLWPDPNDEADGRGVVVTHPRVVAISARSPAWMRSPRLWGDTRASFIPGEQDSPPGPAFQPGTRWKDPDAFAASARSCQASCNHVNACDAPERGVTLGLAAIPAGLLLLLIRRRYGRPRTITDLDSPAE